MRIYDTGQQPSSISSASTQQTQRPDAAGRGDGVSPARSSRSDEVRLSALGSYLAAETNHSEREAKVASLAAVYASGNYSVSPETVSSRILDDATHAR